MKRGCQHLAERIDRGLSADVLADLEPAARQELVEHLRACPSCRRAAVEGDPTVVFSLLEADRLGAGQIAEIQSTVRTLRRSRAMEAGGRSRSRGARRSGMVAASLALAFALLPLTGERPLEDGAEPMVDRVSEQQPRALSEWQQWIDDRTVPPVIEELNRPGARVYQLIEEDLSVVMIVDETLDL